ncbi:MAG TPA: hypothetical protein VH951_07160, partial [Dehalococcoidia bacterium]
VTWGATNTPSTMAANGVQSVTVGLTNSGTQVWNAGGTNPVRVSYHWRSGACPGTASVVWDGLRTTLPADVAEGASLSALSVQVRAPSAPGTYCLLYDVVKEGVLWLSGAGSAPLSKTIAVN